jgi:hypothetical protein
MVARSIKAAPNEGYVCYIHEREIPARRSPWTLRAVASSLAAEGSLEDKLTRGR